MPASRRCVGPEHHWRHSPSLADAALPRLWQGAGGGEQSFWGAAPSYLPVCSPWSCPVGRQQGRGHAAPTPVAPLLVPSGRAQPRGVPAPPAQHHGARPALFLLLCALLSPRSGPASSLLLLLQPRWRGEAGGHAGPSAPSTAGRGMGAPPPPRSPSSPSPFPWLCPRRGESRLRGITLRCAQGGSDRNARSWGHRSPRGASSSHFGVAMPRASGAQGSRAPLIAFRGDWLQGAGARGGLGEEGGLRQGCRQSRGAAGVHREASLLPQAVRGPRTCWAALPRAALAISAAAPR